MPDRARGAYLAQKNGLKQITPNLIDALRVLADDESPDAWLVTSAVIDSLVQLEADVAAKYQSVASRLVEAGLLTEPEAAELTSQIDLHVNDFRSNKSAPLTDATN